MLQNALRWTRGPPLAGLFEQRLEGQGNVPRAWTSRKRRTAGGSKCRDREGAACLGCMELPRAPVAPAEGVERLLVEDEIRKARSSSGPCKELGFDSEGVQGF